MNEDFVNLEKKPKSKKDIVYSILVIVFIVILVVGFVFLRENRASEILSAMADSLRERAESVFAPEEEDKADIVWTTPEEDILGEEREGYYTEVAERGDGLTHLARRALTSHMEKENIELSSEQRIYIEDYVQKRLAPEKTGLRFLEIGEEIEISVDLIEEGIAQAENLTPSQIDNLSKYTPLVSF